MRRRRDIFCNGRPEDEKEGATTLFADLPGECLRPNISHGDIGGRKPTFEDLCALTERIGDFALADLREPINILIAVSICALSERRKSVFFPLQHQH